MIQLAEAATPGGSQVRRARRLSDGAPASGLGLAVAVSDAIEGFYRIELQGPRL